MLLIYVWFAFCRVWTSLTRVGSRRTSSHKWPPPDPSLPCTRRGGGVWRRQRRELCVFSFSSLSLTLFSLSSSSLLLFLALSLLLFLSLFSPYPYLSILLSLGLFSFFFSLSLSSLSLLLLNCNYVIRLASLTYQNVVTQSLDLFQCCSVCEPSLSPSLQEALRCTSVYWSGHYHWRCVHRSECTGTVTVRV